jgi:hypothetical protein
MCQRRVLRVPTAFIVPVKDPWAFCTLVGTFHGRFLGVTTWRVSMDARSWYEMLEARDPADTPGRERIVRPPAAVNAAITSLLFILRTP